VLEFALDVIAVFYLGGALIVLGPGRALRALEPHPSPIVRYIIETVVGVALLVVAAMSGRGRGCSPATPEGSQRGRRGERALRRAAPGER
jgi:hypothetical protein